MVVLSRTTDFTLNPIGVDSEGKYQ